MLDQLRIPTERDFPKAPANLNSWDPVACPMRLVSHTVARPAVATSASTPAEAALILAAPKLAAVPPPFSHPLRSPRPASRIVDVAIAGSLCAVLLPVLALIVIYLLVLERGPVFFAHRRIGLNGQPFACLKFRTMCTNADQRLELLLATDPAMRREWDSTQKLLCDPRVTRFGRILRNTSLDELPQLINVLRGDMSIVGPRPIVEDEMRRYGRYLGHYTSVRPGLTGLWQVTRNARTSYGRRVATDVHYVRNQSVAFDLRILLATIPAVLAGNG